MGNVLLDEALGRGLLGGVVWLSVVLAVLADVVVLDDVPPQLASTAPRVARRIITSMILSLRVENKKLYTQ